MHIKTTVRKLIETHRKQENDSATFYCSRHTGTKESDEPVLYGADDENNKEQINSQFPRRPYTHRVSEATALTIKATTNEIFFIPLFETKLSTKVIVRR